MLASFTHSFGGTYPAGYYGYLWAEVIGANIWDRFAREGEQSAAVGADYRRIILGPHGVRPSSELVREFLGHEPSVDVWLARVHDDATVSA